MGPFPPFLSIQLNWGSGMLSVSSTRDSKQDRKVTAVCSCLDPVLPVAYAQGAGTAEDLCWYACNPKALLRLLPCFLLCSWRRRRTCRRRSTGCRSSQRRGRPSCTSWRRTWSASSRVGNSVFPPNTHACAHAPAHTRTHTRTHRHHSFKLF